MPRGDKSKYTGKQERKADHIAESYESRGVPEMEAERRAWATVNKESGGGKWRRTRRRGNCWPNWPEAPDGPSNGPPQESF
jgi:plasmid stabilization system protein ParE